MTRRNRSRRAGVGYVVAGTLSLGVALEACGSTGGPSATPGGASGEAGAAGASGGQAGTLTGGNAGERAALGGPGGGGGMSADGTAGAGLAAGAGGSSGGSGNAGVGGAMTGPCGAPLKPASFAATCDEAVAIPGECSDITDDFCKVRAGCVLLGSPTCEPGRAAAGEEQVWANLSHYLYASRREVTLGDWQGLGLPDPNAGNAKVCHAASCPVVNVTWYEALYFANQLSNARGYSPFYILKNCRGSPGQGMTCDGAELGSADVNAPGFRLPTEIEWEYLGRSTTTTSYYSGDISMASVASCAADDALTKAAWYCVDAMGEGHTGGTKEANGWGLVDMLGNASEWVASAYDPAGYGSAPLVDDQAGALGAATERVVRGGSFFDSPAACRAAARSHAPAASRDLTRGFRLVRTTPGPTGHPTP